MKINISEKECTFPDPQNGIITKTMYVGDRTSPAYFYDEKNNQVSGKDEQKWNIRFQN